MKLTLLLAITVFTTQLVASTADIELARYPFLISSIKPNEKINNDLDTIRYTPVFRFSPRSEKDLDSYKKTYKRNDLTNNSVIGIVKDYPSWLIDQIQEYNQGKDSEELIRVWGRAYTFGPSVFTHHNYNGSNGRWYERTKKARNADGKRITVKESESIKSSKYILTNKEYNIRPLFAFDPYDFDNDQDHILRFKEDSKFYIDSFDHKAIGPREAPLKLAGKDIKFLETKKGVYKYRLQCRKEYEDSIDDCRSALESHYNTKSDDSPRNTIDQYLSNKSWEAIQHACFHCTYEPYFKISNADEDFFNKGTNNTLAYKDRTYLPSMTYRNIDKGNGDTYRYHLSEKDVFESLYAIDNDFEFMQRLLNSQDQFQIMISRLGGKNIKSVTYPENVYASYHYSRSDRGSEAKAKTLLNPYSACMFQKVQKEHLKNIIESQYFALNKNFRDELHQCLKKHHPKITEKTLQETRTIIKLFEKGDHPCSDHVLNTGAALQYGDMGIAYNFKTFPPHDSHKYGRCIDARPMRQTHIDRATFLEKIEYEIKEVKNEAVIKDVDQFVKELASNGAFIEGLRTTQFLLEKKIPELFKSVVNEKGEKVLTGKIHKYSELSSEMKKFVMGEYINNAIELHDQGRPNPAVSAYFKFSIKAIDATYDSVKDENTTNDFIKLLKEQGADNDSIAYSEGSRTYGRAIHANRYYSLGLELTKNWSNHNDHVHFCFDYQKTETLLNALIEKKKELQEQGLYSSKQVINESMNKGNPDSVAVDYFQGLWNKVDCLKYVPSEFNSNKKEEVLELLKH